MRVSRTLRRRLKCLAGTGGVTVRLDAQLQPGDAVREQLDAHPPRGMWLLCRRPDVRDACRPDVTDAAALGTVATQTTVTAHGASAPLRSAAGGEIAGRIKSGSIRPILLWRGGSLRNGVWRRWRMDSQNFPTAMRRPFNPRTKVECAILSALEQRIPGQGCERLVVVGHAPGRSGRTGRGAGHRRLRTRALIDDRPGHYVPLELSEYGRSRLKVLHRGREVGRLCSHLNL
jgi:hypothetical protein